MSKIPKLTVLFEKFRGQIFNLEQDTITIGRRDEMDITLKDASVSGHHADIIRTEQDGQVCFILRDNGSTNGTKVNNEPITEKVLRNSDLISFGHVEVLFDGAPGAAEDQHITHTIDLGSTATNTATTQTLANFSARMMLEKKKSAQLNMIMKAIVIIGGIAVLVLVCLTLYEVFKSTTR